MSTHVAEQTIDAVIGRRISTVCWFCAGLGVSMLQMLLLAQTWSVSRQALVPAFMASAWVIGSLVGAQTHTTTRLWGSCLIACILLWFIGPWLVSWRLTRLSTAVVSDGTLMVIALLLGAISTAWLCQRRPWPAARERLVLARGLLGTTTGLFMVWVLPAWVGLMALACLIPLLALDYQPAGRSPLPTIGSVVETWVGRYWSSDGWQLHVVAYYPSASLQQAQRAGVTLHRKAEVLQQADFVTLYSASRGLERDAHPIWCPATALAQTGWMPDELCTRQGA